MDIWKKYASPLGYHNGNNGIDSYGVNHNEFSLQDELAYQMARNKREQQMIQNYNNQGMTKNYPQVGVRFWENSPDNNYGFGTSNISGNIDNVTNQLTNQQQNLIKSRVWETSADGKQVYDDVIRNEGNFKPIDQNVLDYTKSAIQGGMSLVGNFSNMKKMRVTKHAMLNCNAAQYGQGGADIVTLASNLREWNDKRTGSNTIDSSDGDQYANKIGRLLGSKYPKGNCDELVQKYIKKNW